MMIEAGLHHFVTDDAFCIARRVDSRSWEFTKRYKDGTEIKLTVPTLRKARCLAYSHSK